MFEEQVQQAKKKKPIDKATILGKVYFWVAN